jgi:hypothetical protein
VTTVQGGVGLQLLHALAPINDYYIPPGLPQALGASSNFALILTGSFSE